MAKEATKQVCAECGKEKSLDRYNFHRNRKERAKTCKECALIRRENVVLWQTDQNRT